MTCQSYNLIKDACLDVTVSGLLPVGTKEKEGLYDGNLTTPAIIVSNTSAKYTVEFGEAFDICYVDYYTNIVDINNVSIFYSVASGGSYASFSAISGQQYRATINSPATTIQILHTASGVSDSVYQVEVSAVKLSDVATGSDLSKTPGGISAGVGAIGVSGSLPVKHILHNTSMYDKDLKIAVTPTSNPEDDYIQLATKKEGPYYGINDFGVKQPSLRPLLFMGDDAMQSNVLNDQWDTLLGGSVHKVSPTTAGVVIEVGAAASQRIFAKTPSFETVGITTISGFSSQSFMAEFEVLLQTVGSLGFGEVFFVVTNGYPTQDIGYDRSFNVSQRRGAYTAGISLKSSTAAGATAAKDLSYFFRVVDGPEDDKQITGDLDSRWTSGVSSGSILTEQPGQIVETQGPTLFEMDDIVNEGVSLSAFSGGNFWNNWKITYEEDTNLVTAYVNNIKIGEYYNKVELPKEDLHLALGINGSETSIVVRNFKVSTDNIYKQRSITVGCDSPTVVASATISGTTAALAVDGDVATGYVGPNPSQNVDFRIDFGSPQDVVYYKVRQRDINTPMSAYGDSYFPDIATNVIADFGGLYNRFHTFPDGTEFATEANVVPYDRSPSVSGVLMVASGIDYLNLKFTSYNASSQAVHGLVLTEVDVITEYYRKITSATVTASGESYAWSAGSWSNISQAGTGNYISIKDKVSPEAGFTSLPERMQRGYNYGTSSEKPQDSNFTADFPYTSSIFSVTATNTYHGWFSEIQPSSDFWIWRKFEGISSIKAIYWDSATAGSRSVADIFKFQALVVGADPNLEESWYNINPVSSVHVPAGDPGDAAYTTYRNYLIANNDGEFYTSYFSRPADTQFTIGDISASDYVTTAVPTTYSISETAKTSATLFAANGSNGFIEFDSPIVTGAIRMVISQVKDSGEIDALGNYVTGTAGNTIFSMTLAKLKIYRQDAVAIYTSPVFDLETSQNTERIAVDAHIPNGTGVRVFVRGSDTSPKYGANLVQTVWKDLGAAGEPDSSLSFNENSVLTHTVVEYNGLALFLPGAPIFGSIQGTPVTYDPKLDQWSVFADYPSSATSKGGPSSGSTGGAPATFQTDDTILGAAGVLPDNTIIVSVLSNESIKQKQHLRYFPNSGWEVLPNTRPDDTSNSLALYDGYNVYYFSDQGVVSVYDVLTDGWRLDLPNVPTHTTSGFLAGSSGIIKDGKAYIFGGADGQVGALVGYPVTDIYDINTGVTVSGKPPPVAIAASRAFLLADGRHILVLPYAISGFATERAPAQRYDIETDEWIVLESLGFGRSVFSPATSFYKKTDYYYKVGPSIYAIEKQGSQARIIADLDAWTSGQLPYLLDDTWGNNYKTPWKEIGIQSQLLPQKRYVQLEVHLTTTKPDVSPTVKGITIVKPQIVPVTSSGTAAFYTRSNIIGNREVELFYSAELLTTVAGGGNQLSILRSHSKDGSLWTLGEVTRKASISGSITQAFEDPWVYKKSTGDYRMWYSDVSYSTGTRTPSAIATISGTTAEMDSSKVISILPGSHSKSASGVTSPSLIIDDTISYMWYAGLDGGGVSRIFKADSTDGIVWGNMRVAIDVGASNLPLDTLSLSDPFVINVGSKYRIWYTGKDSEGTLSIITALSADGENWAQFSSAVPSGFIGSQDCFGASSPSIVFDGVTYIMYYLGNSGSEVSVIKITSADGLIWAGPTVVMPPGGVSGFVDGKRIQSISAVVTFPPIVPGTTLTQGSIKVYD